MVLRHRERTVLVVEDDVRLGELVIGYLESAGFTAFLEGRGDRVAARLAEIEPQILLLDLSLPGKSGLDVCREIRESYGGWIVMLTARTQEIDEVLGLELGADDYLAKPVRPRALLARLEKLLKRSQAQKADAFEVGPLRICPGEREVYLEGRAIDLTSLEYELLMCFAQRPGTVVSREDLFSELRGIEWDGIDRWVDLAVSRLRRKLKGGALIKTVRSRGYFLGAGKM